MKASEFLEKLNLALEQPSWYVLGGWGAPLSYGNNLNRYTSNYQYNINHAAEIRAHSNCFAWDCICLGKGILWGWSGRKDQQNGGAQYGSNGVPDFSVESLKNYCTKFSSDFSDIIPGAWLYMQGHIGYYIGGGMCIECTPKWDGCVQKSQVWNIKKTKSKGRTWLAWGLPRFIDYSEEPQPVPEDLKVGDIVHIKEGAPVYGKSYKYQAWVYKALLYVRAIDGDRIVVSILKEGAVTGPVDRKYIIKDPTPAPEELKIGDTVKLRQGARVYNKSYGYQSWVYNATLYVREIDGDRIVISIYPEGAVTGPVYKADLTRC